MWEIVSNLVAFLENLNFNTDQAAQEQLSIPLNKLHWELVRQHLETTVISTDMLQLFMRGKGPMNVNIAKRAFQKSP